MTTAASLIERMFAEAFNQGDLASLDELVAVNDSARVTERGLSAMGMGLKQWITALRIAFPDLHCTIEEQITMRDQVAVRWSMRGTHKGLFMGNRPTGKQMQTQGVIFGRLVDGMPGEYWLLIDTYGMLQQLGIIPG